jgi:hypothetical protein
MRIWLDWNLLAAILSWVGWDCLLFFSGLVQVLRMTVLAVQQSLPDVLLSSSSLVVCWGWWSGTWKGCSIVGKLLW